MNQRRLLIAVLGFFVVLGIVMGVSEYFRMRIGPGGPWAGRVFGGTITHISATEISVADVHGTQKTFEITSLTKLRKGKNSVATSSLSVGVFVMVDSTPAPEGQVAREVRVLSTTTRPERFVAPKP